MVLIVWDRIFGTFTEELPDEPPHYGLLTPLEKPHNPVRIIFHEWQSIRKDIKSNTSFKNKLRYLLHKPGWSHDGSKLTAKQLQAIWEKERSNSSRHCKERSNLTN